MKVMCLLTQKALTVLTLDYRVTYLAVLAMAMYIRHNSTCMLKTFFTCSLYIMLQNQLCVASGPGEDMFDSTRIIGEKQFSAGKVQTKR